LPIFERQIGYDLQDFGSKSAKRGQIVFRRLQKDTPQKSGPGSLGINAVRPASNNI
jgi:hypothetical protein